MAVRFFGQFLLENGVIDAKQLLAAISYQEKTNLKFGDTAISLGLLDEDKLAQVFALQRSEDLRSGEAAIKLGLLTQAQVDQVLRAQKNSHVMIGEALVKTGALSEEKLAGQLQAFKKDQEVYESTTGVPAGQDPSGLAGPAVDLSMKFLMRLVNFSIKLIGFESTLPPVKGVTTCTARIGFTGDVNGELALRASDRICARIAAAMLGEPVAPDAKSTILDATSEFLNVVGGNLSAAAARTGKKLELTAPKTGEIATATAKQQMLVARLGAPEGEIHIAFLVDK